MKKKVLIILSCLWFIISFLIIRATYAKYLTSLGSNANIGIASWKILLNNQDIMNNSDFSSNVNLVFPGNNYYLANYIVPEALGYFDLVIDSSEIVLPFRFTITATADANNDIADAKIVGYSYPGQVDYITYLAANATSIQGSANGSVNSTTIRVYVSWNDDASTQLLNDVQDTALALNSADAILNVNVSFEQLSS